MRERPAITRGGTLLASLAVLTLLAPACGSKVESSSSGTGAAAAAADSTSIRVGVLHSLSGTMAISEVSVKDAELLAIDEINAKGGVLGKKIVPTVEDGASDWPTFAEKAQKLISVNSVAAVFGGWTSASRKAMLPVFERNHSLLYYPVQYEGLESSPDIYYTGATTNQQIVPALDYLKSQGKTKLFLVGSDYVFPRTANKEIKAYAAANGMQILGEEYTPLGNTEYATVVNKIKAASPDAVFNTLNGDSNVAFFKQLHSTGITADQLPVMSVSIAEEEVRGIGADNSPASSSPGTTTRPPTRRRTRGSSPRKRRSTGRTGSRTTRSRPDTPRSIYGRPAVRRPGRSMSTRSRRRRVGITFDAPRGR